MMLTAADVEILINTPKLILENKNIVERKTIVLKEPVVLRFILVSELDNNQKFLLDIKQSKKKEFKISFHHLDKETDVGLLRVDYNGRHKNPEVVKDTVPEKFRPFAGQFLDDYQGHIHYFVDGYPPLAWAIPLEIDDFPVKKLLSLEDLRSAFKAFIQKINIITSLEVLFQNKVL